MQGFESWGRINTNFGRGPSWDLTGGHDSTSPDLKVVWFLPGIVFAAVMDVLHSLRTRMHCLNYEWRQQRRYIQQIQELLLLIVQCWREWSFSSYICRSISRARKKRLTTCFKWWAVVWLNLMCNAVINPEKALQGITMYSLDGLNASSLRTASNPSLARVATWRYLLTFLIFVAFLEGLVPL